MSEVDNKVKMIVEGLLLAAGRPLSLDNIIAVFSEDEKPDKKELKNVMSAISDSCDDRGFELIEVASGYRFQVKQDLSEWVAKLWEERPPRYTRALLETLSLVAYRQPITRGDIEEIRGVAVSPNIIRTLLDREWIRVVGHRDVPGRPAMFATTKQFLDYFNLKSLQELPPLAEVKELVSANNETDLTEDLMNQRVLDLPEDAVDENAVELSEEEKAELLAEEEAIELSKKPLDEILHDDPARRFEEADMDDEEGESEDGTPDMEAADEEEDLPDDDWPEDNELAETEALVDSFEIDNQNSTSADSDQDLSAESASGEDEEIAEAPDEQVDEKTDASSATESEASDAEENQLTP